MSRKTPFTDRSLPTRLALVPLAAALVVGVTVPADAATATPRATGGESVVVVRSVKGRLVVEKQRVANRVFARSVAQRLTRRADVVAASLDSRVSIDSDPLESHQWALGDLSATTTWTGGAANGQVVAVIDTGVKGDVRDLAGVVLPGGEFLAGGSSRSTGNGWNDTNSHGTEVASVIAAKHGNGIGIKGFAPGAKILPVKVMGNDGTGWVSDVAAGIIWAVDNGATVLNLSLGSSVSTPVEKAAVDYALSKDVVVVAAAGNSYEDGNPVQYPAAYPGVIGVGAHDKVRRIAPFSQRGSFVDVTAPGVGIAAISPDNRTYLNNGTSYAAPFVAATAALARARAPQASAATVSAALTSTALDLGVKGRDDTFGYGAMNPAAAVAKVAPGRVKRTKKTAVTVSRVVRR